MWNVIKEQFDYGLQQFVESVLDRQDSFDYRTTAIAFHTGYIYDKEGYKRQAWAKAHKILDDMEWKEEMIGSGRILEGISRTMAKKIDGQMNQVLNWRNFAFMRSSFKKEPVECERVIYNIYKGDDEKQAFEDAVALWGATYPVITYLYFLKDRHTYMPVRPHRFTEPLKRLGFTTDCLSECTWENYLEFMEILKWMQKELIRHLDDSAELIDAHSVLSLMEDVEDRVPTEDSREILQMDYFDTAVVTGPHHNRKKEYYLSAYEKVPEYREAAVSAHGYSCMACGFHFEHTYGAIGRRFTEVHHVKPFSSLEDATRLSDLVNPEEDFVCLCSNCHRLIHRNKNSVMSLEELKQWLLWGPIWEQR